MAYANQIALPDSLKRPLLVSATAHAGLVALMLLGMPAHQRGESWGGPGGGAVQVSLVRRLPGISLPRPPVVTQSRRATESRGLHREEPKPEPPRQEQAQALPRFGEEPKPAPRRRRRREEPPVVNPPGAIPQGEGGPPALPYTSFQPPGAEGGMSFGSGGAFGGRYPWYVDSVRRRISSNWLLSSIDPYVQWAPRVVVSFEILRNGTVVNLQVLRASGVASVDRSAVRAVRASAPLDRLPSDHVGDKVRVEFWFDFRRP
jgi:TonB family protein